MERKIVTGVKEWGNVSGSVDYVIEKNIPTSSTILDIGCYSGSIIYNLWARGYRNVYGVDIDQTSISQGKLNYNNISDRLIHYDGAKLPFENNRFDVVTMFDVLEHIESVHEFLEKEIRRVLKSGGMLMFQTPNKYTNIPWEVLSHRSISFYKRYHVSLQSYRSLCHLLQSSGFIDISIEKRNIWTPYHINQLKKSLGFLAYPALFIGNSLPVRWATNFWGCCRTET